MKKAKPITETLSDLKMALNKMSVELTTAQNDIDGVYSLQDIKRLEYIYEVINQVLEYGKLESASFGRIGDQPIKLKPEEVDKFVKDRMQLWFNTWILGPLNSILQEKGKDWIK